MINDDQVSRDTKLFGDWKIRLGITLGVILFCMGVIVWCMGHPSEPLAAHAAEAWASLRVVLPAMLGAAVASDWLRK